MIEYSRYFFRFLEWRVSFISFTWSSWSSSSSILVTRSTWRRSFPRRWVLPWSSSQSLSSSTTSTAIAPWLLRGDDLRYNLLDSKSPKKVADSLLPSAPLRGAKKVKGGRDILPLLPSYHRLSWYDFSGYIFWVYFLGRSLLNPKTLPPLIQLP